MSSSPPAPMPASSSAFERLFAALTTRAGSEALAFGGRAWTYADLDRISRSYARGLSRLGIRRGDRVAIYAESAPELVFALLGHYRLGAIHVPINPRYSAGETLHILRDSGARAVLFDAGGETARVLESIGEVPGLDIRIALGEAAGAVGVGVGERTGSWDSLAGVDLEAAGAAPAEDEGMPPASDSDVAAIVYTSGTTGSSKGVALSFGALVSNVEALTSAWRFTAADRLSVALPLFHVHGLAIGVHGALLHGMTLLLSARFDAAEIVRDFGERGATVFLGVPTMFVRLLEEIGARPEGSRALARGRLFTSGSAPLAPSDLAAFERATGHRILERYGMTETLFPLSNPYDGERRPGTVGLPVAGCEVAIAGEPGTDSNSGAEQGELPGGEPGDPPADEPGELPGGKPGELLIRGNGLMNGYWGRPGDTAASWRGGWFATGDVAERDTSGYVRILGRRAVDFIKSGGLKIAAREVEDVIVSHPAVREAAVVGVPDRVWGERVVAAVVLREQPPGGAPAEDIAREVLDLCRASLADYKRPKEVRILYSLPRNALGKVQKHRILERMAEEDG